MIRTATREDLAAIAAIQSSAAGASAWNPADYFDYECHVAEESSAEESSVEGFVVSRQLVPGEREILNIAVAPSKRRRGVARRLMKYVLQAFPGTWFLEVRESNAAAISLYKSLGFEAAGYREDYYLSPPEAAIVMRFRS